MSGKCFRMMITVSLLLLSSCITPPEKVYTQVQPQTAPTRNQTSMDEALVCMDRLLAKSSIPPIYVTSPGLPSRAGEKVNLASGPDMLLNTISRLSETSNVFQFVELSHLAPTGVPKQADTTLFDPESIKKWLEQLKAVPRSKPFLFHYPDWIIAGSVSQLDDNVLSETRGIGVKIPNFGDVGLNRDQIVSVVTVDMYLYNWDTLTMRNGSAVSNSMALVRKGLGGDLGGQIRKAGLSLDFSYDRNEGLHQAVRTLIQLSTIEILGKLTRVPYERCLGLEKTQPRTRAAEEQTYDALADAERVKTAQDSLARIPNPETRKPYYSGPTTGQLDSATREAVARYQADSDVIPSGEVDLPTYRKLQGPPPEPLRLEIGTSKGSAPVYRQGDKLDFSVVVNQAAEVHCFIRNAQSEVRRLFPNRSQASARFEPGTAVAIPGNRPAFELWLDQAGVREEIGCIASPASLVSPWPLNLDVLNAPPLPVRNLEEVAVGYRQQTAGPVVLQTMPVQVE